jgi:hypothetical protein
MYDPIKKICHLNLIAWGEKEGLKKKGDSDRGV